MGERHPGAPPREAPGGGAVGLHRRRFEALADRLAAGEREVPPAALYTAAALGAGDGGELRRHLDRLRHAGLAEADPSRAIRVLATGLPDWWPPAGEPVETPTEEALYRVAASTDDAGARVECYRELVATAIERFNAGGVAAAAALFELAARVEAAGRVDAETVEAARSAGSPPLDPDQLRRAARANRSGARFPPLLPILRFFPALAPEPLIRELDQEPHRQRRRLLLSLLEAWGPEARSAAAEALAASFHRQGLPTLWQLQRNLIHLLHHLEPPPEGRDASEVEGVVRLCEPSQAMALIRQAVTYLAEVAEAPAEGALTGLLARVEAHLADPERALHPPAELQRLATQLAEALARIGTGTARRALVDHALRPEPYLGDALGRLQALAGHDLSTEPDLVRRLVEALRAAFPSRVLGLTVVADDERLQHLVAALAATRRELVREALAELAAGYPRHPAAAAARQALDGAAPTQAPAPSASPPPPLPTEGRVGEHGLPALLAALAERGFSGRLALVAPDQGTAGMTLDGGKLVDCAAGHRRGDAAFFQLLEEPFAAVYRLDAGTPVGAAEPRPLGPPIAEGMRRHDELRLLRALVPDGSRLVPTGRRPTPPVGETDGGLVREVWSRAKAGASAADCEAEVAADGFRVRTLLAHWLDEGSLRPAGPT